MPLDTAIRQLFALYWPGGHHGHQFQRKQSSCGVVKSFSKARVKKAQNRPSTQLIEDGGQNGIHCCRQAAIICELTLIHTNNNITAWISI
jgi:hypothetical protein